MRILGKKASPAVFKDSPSIVSINEAIKNTIIYNLIFLGLYYDLSKQWKKDKFILEMLPFVLFGTLLLDFVLRILEIIIDAKGFRYLAQSITLFFLTVLTT